MSASARSRSRGFPSAGRPSAKGRCAANRSFLSLSALGSLSLACYAFERGDAVFSSLNALTALGAAVNIYFSVFPRPWIE